MLSLENIVKNKLNNFEYKDIQSDWSTFEKKLPNKKPSIIKYLAIAAVAAVLLTVLVISLNNNNLEKKDTKKQITEQNKETNKTNKVLTNNKEEEKENKSVNEIIVKKEISVNNTKEEKENTTEVKNTETVNNTEQPKNEKIVENIADNTITTENTEIDDYIPISDFDVSDNKACAPFNANFTAKENHKDVLYTWEFSDGFTSTKRNVKHTFKKAGKYTVKLITEYKNNKKTSTSLQEIEVFKNPKAYFTYTIDDNSYYFDGPDNININWNFGDNTTTNEIDPEHIFKLIGKTKVTLTATNKFGCKTEHTETINIEPIFQIANAFSPDNNGFNDTFGPIFEYPENYDFELYIYNAKGQLYFKSSSANQNWNGRINNTDQIAEKGYYLWKLLIKDKYGHKIIKNGNLNITN